MTVECRKLNVKNPRWWTDLYRNVTNVTIYCWERGLGLPSQPSGDTLVWLTPFITIYSCVWWEGRGRWCWRGVGRVDHLALSRGEADIATVFKTRLLTKNTSSLPVFIAGVVYMWHNRSVHSQFRATRERSTLCSRQAERHSRTWQSVPCTGRTTRRWRQPSQSVRRRTL